MLLTFVRSLKVESRPNWDKRASEVAPTRPPRGFGPAGKTQLVFNQSNGTASDSHNCPAMRVEPSCMRIECVSVQLTALAPGLLLLASLSLGGCASSSVGSSPMDARAEVTDHPKTTAYPAVEDVPPRPDKPAMTADEQSKLKKALIAAREGQAKEKAKQDALRAEPAKP